jgi:4-amino-4-deoxy-L-arabinose transferase-like glycosyltransferase
MNKKNYIKFFLFCFILRVPILIIYGDNGLQNEWGPLVNNLIQNKTLAILNFGDFYLPNLWMPPIYAYFLYLLSFLFESVNNYYINFVLIIQCLISSASALIFYKILQNFYSKKISLCGSLIYTCFPLNVYASVQISSITLTMFFSVLFLLCIINIIKFNKYKYLILFSIISGLLILTRREFIIFFVVTNFFLFFFAKINLKKILLVLLFTSLTVSPYMIRNYIIFDKIIIQAGFGYNLWKAYNPLAKVEGSTVPSKELKIKINSVTKDKFYRINEDRVYLDQAITYLLDDPLKYFKLYLLRLFSYYFIDFNSSEPNYYNFFHILPNIFLSILVVLGLFKYDKNSLVLNYLILIFVLYILIISSFAVLPRYKLYLLPFQIIFSLVCLRKISWYK